MEQRSVVVDAWVQAYERLEEKLDKLGIDKFKSASWIRKNLSLYEKDEMERKEIMSLVNYIHGGE